MPKTTINFGILLTVIGIASGAYAYGFSENGSVTAFIPAFIGLLMIAIGTLANKENLRKHLMHVAVVLALLGALGSLSRAFQADGLGVATGIQWLTGLVCLAYVVLGIKSFMAARRGEA